MLMSLSGVAIMTDTDGNSKLKADCLLGQNIYFSSE